MVASERKPWAERGIRSQQHMRLEVFMIKPLEEKSEASKH